MKVVFDHYWVALNPGSPIPLHLFATVWAVGRLKVLDRTFEIVSHEGHHEGNLSS
jgi:hypothetical protein